MRLEQKFDEGAIGSAISYDPTQSPYDAQTPLLVIENGISKMELNTFSVVHQTHYLSY